MIVVRSLITGARRHFVIRISEWIMLYPSLGMWVGITYLQPDMFRSTKSFSQLAAWAPEETWASFVLACAVVRSGALVVNGTFDRFKYSPHIRMLASLMGLVFWSQFCVGILQAYLIAGGAFSGVIVYSTLVILELVNLYRSSKDIGSTYAEIKSKKNGMGL